MGRLRAGEMRTCTICHGINKTDVVLGLPKPTNPPQALHTLLSWYRNNTANGMVGDTVGVYMPDGAFFALRNSNAIGSPDANFVVPGTGANWIPITGDWDGDGIDTVGFYNPATSVFHLKNSKSSAPTT